MFIVKIEINLRS